MKCSYHDLYFAAKKLLRQVDGGDAEFSARQLVAAATDRSISQLVADFPLTAFQRDIQRVHEMVDRRLKGEPLAYVLGQWEFYGLTLTVTPDVLIPRNDTEAVCDLAINQTRLLKQNPRVLDLCAGTGCIGLAVASRIKDARVTLADISPEAIRVAKKNVQNNHLSGRVSVMQLDVREAPPKFLGTYDLIVSNPPYVTAAQMESSGPLRKKLRTQDRSLRRPGRSGFLPGHCGKLHAAAAARGLYLPGIRHGPGGGCVPHSYAAGL